LICGRLKSDIRYSPSAYNNLSWSIVLIVKRVEERGQKVLDPRKAYPKSRFVLSIYRASKVGKSTSRIRKSSRFVF